MQTPACLRFNWIREFLVRKTCSRENHITLQHLYIHEHIPTHHVTGENKDQKKSVWQTLVEIYFLFCIFSFVLCMAMKLQAIVACKIKARFGDAASANMSSLFKWVLFWARAERCYLTIEFCPRNLFHSFSVLFFPNMFFFLRLILSLFICSFWLISVLF